MHIIILVAAGERQHKDYLRLLSKIMSILREESMRNTIVNSKENTDILEILNIDMES